MLISMNMDTNLAREGLGLGLGTSHVALDLSKLRVTRLSVGHTHLSKLRVTRLSGSEQAERYRYRYKMLLCGIYHPI